MTNKLQFILQHLPRSGSTWLSKLLTENFNACVLPETNFIFYILENSNFEYDELIKIDNKFKDLNVDKRFFNDIKNKTDKFNLINKICDNAASKIYDEKNIIIGLKKTNLKFSHYLMKNKNLKFICLIRDIRDIYLSIVQANKIRKSFQTSLMKNIYEWNMQCIIFDHNDEKKTIKIRYEDLILDKEKELYRLSNFLNLNKLGISKTFYLPAKYTKIHQNINRDSIKKNSKKYLNKLNFFKNFIVKIFCYHHLAKYNYINKNIFLSIINFPIYFIFKTICKMRNNN